MSKYPKEITEEVLQKNSHISDEEIDTDLADTKIEIVNLEKEVEGYNLIATARLGTMAGKMPAFKRDAKQNGLEQRQEFVEFLEKLLEARKQCLK